MSLLAVLPLVLAGLIGGLLMSSLLPRLPGGRANALLRWSAGIGLGSAISSAWTFLWLPLFDGIGLGLVILEGIVVLGLGLLAWWTRHGSPRMPPTPWRSVDLALWGVFVISLGLGVAVYAVRSLSEPHGVWDAWAIWNQRARFLFRAGEGWRRAFSSELGWSHPDYPLLLPSQVVRGWVYVGAETQWVPALVGATYTFATAGLVAACLAILRGRTHGLVAGTLILSTPSFLLKGASQCADVPLGFYFLGALAFLAFEHALPEHSVRLAFVSGAMAGSAMWTKNEGMLFVVCLVAVRAFGALRPRGSGARGRLGGFALGLLPAILLVGYFRFTLAPPNDLATAQSLDHVVASLVSPSRYADVLLAYAMFVWDELALALAVSLVCALLLGLSWRDRGDAIVTEPAAVLSLVAAGYFMVYVTTPKPLAWHLATSLSRLAIQLWPSALLCVFLLTAPERVTPSSKRAD